MRHEMIELDRENAHINIWLFIKFKCIISTLEISLILCDSHTSSVCLFLRKCILLDRKEKIVITTLEVKRNYCTHNIGRQSLSFFLPISKLLKNKVKTHSNSIIQQSYKNR